MRRIYAILITLLTNMYLFAIDPHGSRVDEYGRRYSSGGGAGILVVIVVIVVVAAIIMSLSKSQSSKNETISSNVPDKYRDYYDYLEMKRRWEEREKKSKQEEKGCIFGLVLGLIWFVLYVANQIYHFIN